MFVGCAFDMQQARQDNSQYFIFIPILKLFFTLFLYKYNESEYKTTKKRYIIIIITNWTEFIKLPFSHCSFNLT